jgi:hypothetical protein
MIRLLRKLLQTDAYEKVGIFSACLLFVVAAVLAYGKIQQSEKSSNEQWAKDRGTQYAARE